MLVFPAAPHSPAAEMTQGAILIHLAELRTDAIEAEIMQQVVVPADAQFAAERAGVG